MTTGALGALILCVEVFLLSFAAIAVFWFADWWRRGIGPQHKDYARGRNTSRPCSGSRQAIVKKGLTVPASRGH
jgi:hypothetical protein